MNGDASKGVTISISNLKKMPMPVVGQITFKDGTTQNFNLPVDIWRRNKDWSFNVPTTKEITSVTLDPNATLPDNNTSNNTFNMESGAAVSKINLKDYIGVFSNKQMPVKFTLKEENNTLMAQASGQEFFPLEYQGNDEFSFDVADIKIKFAKDKKSFDITQGGQTFTFSK